MVGCLKPAKLFSQGFGFSQYSRNLHKIFIRTELWKVKPILSIAGHRIGSDLDEKRTKGDWRDAPRLADLRGSDGSWNGRLDRRGASECGRVRGEISGGPAHRHGDSGWGSDGRPRTSELVHDSTAAAVSGDWSKPATSACGGWPWLRGGARNRDDLRYTRRPRSRWRQTVATTYRTCPHSRTCLRSPDPLGATVATVLDTSLIPGRSIEPIDLVNALRLAGVRELDIAIARRRVNESMADLDYAGAVAAEYVSRSDLVPGRRTGPDRERAGRERESQLIVRRRCGGDHRSGFRGGFAGYGLHTLERFHAVLPILGCDLYAPGGTSEC